MSDHLSANRNQRFVSLTTFLDRYRRLFTAPERFTIIDEKFQGILMVRAVAIP